jgi:hypothetical protein
VNWRNRSPRRFHGAEAAAALADRRGPLNVFVTCAS